MQDLPTSKDTHYSNEEIALLDTYRERYKEGVKLLERAYRKDVVTKVSVEQYERAIIAQRFGKVDEYSYERSKWFRDRVDKQLRYGDCWWRPTTKSMFKPVYPNLKGIRILKRYNLTTDSPVHLWYVDTCLISAIYVPENTKRVVLNLGDILFIYDETSNMNLKELLKESNEVPPKVSIESLLKLSKSTEYDEKDYRKSKTICRNGVVYKRVELLYPFIPTYSWTKYRPRISVVNDKDDFFYMEEIFIEDMLHKSYYEKEHVLFSRYSRYRVPVFVLNEKEVYNVQTKEAVNSTDLMDCKIPPKNMRRMWDPEIVTQRVPKFNAIPVD